jgi:DNA-binding transcriptional regulator PaaX
MAGKKRKEVEDFGHIGAAKRDVYRMEKKGKIRPEDKISKQYYIDLAKHGKAYAKRAYEKAYHKKHDVKYDFRPEEGPRPAQRTPPPPAGVKNRKYNKG